jgi:hypothetical protein
MKYVLLLYENDAERVAKTDEQVSTCLAYAEAMRKAGILAGGARLRPAASATTVQVADHRTQVLDGPYVEAKEQLGGFHIIDVPDLDAALAWAGRCPSARCGRVEVRPIWPS